MFSAEITTVEEVVEVPECTQAPNEPDTEPEVQEGTPDERKKGASQTTEDNVGEETAPEHEGQQQHTGCG
ncbi:hypothetical protein RF55_9019 [Lasius niger]|uniref:Uncharacterized protein n=1 Tax=Lasius niger TaxID=67767 RepID=A0A0J7NF53_LASNI|nr:hypothetical protein RF55_9019 [Lasius niger]